MTLFALIYPFLRGIYKLHVFCVHQASDRSVTSQASQTRMEAILCLLYIHTPGSNRSSRHLTQPDDEGKQSLREGTQNSHCEENEGKAKQKEKLRKVVVLAKLVNVHSLL